MIRILNALLCSSIVPNKDGTGGELKGDNSMLSNQCQGLLTQQQVCFIQSKTLNETKKQRFVFKGFFFYFEGNCAHHCVGNDTCACFEGFKLKLDKKTCEGQFCSPSNFKLYFFSLTFCHVM